MPSSRIRKRLDPWRSRPNRAAIARFASAGGGVLAAGTATGSTLVSQLVDSFVVLYVAFYVFGNWSMDQVLSVANTNYWYKFAAAILLTPVLYLAHYLIDRYLGPEETAELQEEAAVNASV